MKKAEEREQIALDRISQANKILGKSESNEESLVAAKTSAINTREQQNKESILSSIKVEEESAKMTDNTK